MTKDKLTWFAIVLLLIVIGLSLGAGWISQHFLGFDPARTDLRARNQPPTWAKSAWVDFQQFTFSCQKQSGCQWAYWGPMIQKSWRGLGDCWRLPVGQCHWLGTDETGRDVLTRGLYAGRISLRIGFYVALITMSVGVVLGLVSGYFATTWIDDIINAVVLTLDSVPLLFLLIILARLFQPGPEGLALLLGAFAWTGVARLVRGQVFSVRERDYILASHALGCSLWRILFRHILPNIASIVIVAAVFQIAAAIIAEAGLSFLGVGIGPPHPSWGNMMQGSLGNFTNAPWLVVTPGFFIFLTTLSIYLIGDGLRDALDPMVRRK